MSTGWTILALFFWKAPPTARVDERTKFLAPPLRPNADDDAATTERIARDVLIFMVGLIVFFFLI